MLQNKKVRAGNYHIGYYILITFNYYQVWSIRRSVVIDVIGALTARRSDSEAELLITSNKGSKHDQTHNQGEKKTQVVTSLVVPKMLILRVLYALFRLLLFDASCSNRTQLRLAPWSSRTSTETQLVLSSS